MDRRAFFSLAGAFGLAPLVGCEVRDRPPPAPDEIADLLPSFRSFTIPDGVVPALDFQPLRQKR